MYHRRYSGGRLAWFGTAARRNPRRSGEELRARAVVRRIRGLQLAAAAIPADQFCRGEKRELSRILSFLLHVRQTRELSLASTIATHSPSLILSIPHNCWIHDTISTHWPLQLLWGSQWDERQRQVWPFHSPFALLSPSPFFALSAPCLFPPLIRGELVTVVRKRRIYNSENNVRGIDDCPEEPPRSTTTSWMDERPTRGIGRDTGYLCKFWESRNFRSFQPLI